MRTEKEIRMQIAEFRRMSEEFERTRHGGDRNESLRLADENAFRADLLEWVLGGPDEE